MKTLFDYIYYKLTKLYSKSDNTNGDTAICGLAFMQTILLFDFVYIPLKLIFPSIPELHHASIKYTMIVIMVSLVFINRWHYNGKYEALKERFGGESFRILKTILIFIIMLVLPCVILIAGLSFT